MRQADEEEDLSNCWTTLRNRENAGILKRKH
jgi:hypothetical protein